MPDRAYFVPSSTRNDRLAWRSDRMQMLSGCEWRFAYYPSIHDLKDRFYLPDYEAGKWWKKEMVPFSWQMRGYDSQQYTNIRYPFPFDPPYVPQDNPCGAYLHTFEWHRDPKAPCVFLNFEGVDSCFYVWLNGTYVGYSQVSRHTSEFDVTELMQEGNNLLAVLVLKWCDGSYLEDQDKFRFSGIFRDVYLLNRPADRIENYVIETDLSDDFQSAGLNIRFVFSRKPVPVSLTLVSLLTAPEYCTGKQYGRLARGVANRRICSSRMASRSRSKSRSCGTRRTPFCTRWSWIPARKSSQRKWAFAKSKSGTLSSP